MSRAYRIAVSETVTRVVHVEDGVQTALELLPVLPPADLARILEAELAKRGFARADGEEIMVRVEKDGVVVEVELTTGKVTVSLAEEAELEATAQRSEATARDDATAQQQVRDRLSERATAAAEAQVADQAEVRRQEVTKRLERRLADLRQELDQVTNRVTADALKARAAQIGEIEEVSEDAESGELTIKVKV